MLGNALLWEALNHKMYKCYCVSPSFKQASNIYQTLIDAVGPKKYGIVKNKNKTRLEIEFINGSRIKFASAEQGVDALRGYSADFLCIDEGCFIQDDIFYTAVLPWVSKTNGNVICCSTPWIRQGWFHTYYQFGLDPNKKNVVTIDWSDEKFKESIALCISAERLAEIKAQIPARIFNTEYLGLWADSDGLVFQNIRKCVEHNEIKPTDKLFVGLDWSNQGENDDTVISIFNQDAKQVFVKKFNNLSPLKQIDVIYKELEPYLNQIAVITSETNSLGKPYTDLLKQKSQVITNKLVEFTTTNGSKNAIVTNMQVALENNEVKLLDDDALINQFSYFSCDYNPKTRNVTYGAPQGLHDDIVLATLFAYDGLRLNNKRGVYKVR